MATSKLKFVSKTDMFGTTISLATRDGSYEQVVVTGFNPADPLKNMDGKVKAGYMFRSPNIRIEDWAPTMGSLSNCEGKFNLTAELSEKNEQKTVTAWLRFAERDDAALFAWANVDIWQKWSDDLEKQAKSESKAKKPKIKIGKDGKITVTVKTTTLGK
jgi:hypothetical protein